MKDDITKLDISLKENPPYYLGHNIGKKFSSAVKDFFYDRLFVVTDNNLLNLFGKDIQETFEGLPYKMITISGAESEKSVTTLESLCETLIDEGITKESIIVAFGGGVIGNISGLAAALIFRGVRFIEMPTTFMHQTDGTLSNKQAVNGKKNKNLFGCYYAPLFIWVDTKFVFFESSKRIKCGLVESIKNALIENRKFLVQIDEYLKGDIKDREKLQKIILLSVLSKIEILKKDPGEKNYGVILEYGHTFGHAIERLSNGAKPHGECVAIGMIISAKISHRLGLLNDAGLQTHYDFLRDKIFLDLTIPSHITSKILMDTIFTDNKKTSRGVRYVLLADINKIYNPDGDFMTQLDPVLVTEIINEYMVEMKDSRYNVKCRMGEEFEKPVLEHIPV
ncbi:MAG: iron-containing alcohol dehydrogenase [Ferruginibacter sp.]